MTSPDSSGESRDLPRSVKDIPGEEGRKVWIEMYPGGDAQIEVGFMDSVEELYLTGEEFAALRSLVEEFPEREELCEDCGKRPHETLSSDSHEKGANLLICERCVA